MRMQIPDLITLAVIPCLALRSGIDIVLKFLGIEDCCESLDLHTLVFASRHEHSIERQATFCVQALASN